MIFEDRILHTSQSGLDRLNLLQDVDAISIFLDHSTDSAHLSFNTIETLAESLFINDHIFPLTDTL